MGGVCAALITSMILHPLETYKNVKQINLSIKNIRNPYAGVWVNMCGSAGSTGLYFFIYEHIHNQDYSPCIHILRPAIASTAAITVSTAFLAPISIHTKRLQYKKNLKTNRPPAKISFRTLRNVYGVSLGRNIPKSIVKYTIYESIVSINIFPIFIMGFLAAFVSTLICTLVFIPLDYMSTQLSVGTQNITFSFKNMYSGCHYALLHSLLSNSFGHSLIELLSPR